MDQPFWLLYLSFTVNVSVVVLGYSTTEFSLGHKLWQRGNNDFLGPNHLHNIEIFGNFFAANIVYSFHPGGRTQLSRIATLAEENFASELLAWADLAMVQIHYSLHDSSLLGVALWI